jgi:hypothetical protein
VLTSGKQENGGADLRGEALREHFKRFARLPITRCLRARNYAAAARRSVAHKMGDGFRLALAEIGKAVVAGIVVFIVSGSLAFLLKWPVSVLGFLIGYSLVCGILVVLFLTILNWTESDAFQSFIHRLVTPCRPDDDPYNSQVELQGDSSVQQANFLGEFLKVPAPAPRALLILKQTKKEWLTRQPYTTDGIYAQLRARKRDKRASKIKIDWVCFVTKHRTFVAYQPFDAFEAEILEKRNAKYADILCEPDTATFCKRLNEEIAAYTRYKDTRVPIPNTIPRLATALLPDSLTKKQAILELARKDATEGMLASKDRKPLGMVTLPRLVKSTFDDKIIRPSEMAALDKLLAKWNRDSNAAAAAVEKTDIPSPPAPVPDDNPELDAMVRRKVIRSLYRALITPP